MLPPWTARSAEPYRFRGADAIGAAAIALRRQIMGYRVAIVGATGNVGREILNILAERQFPLDEVAAVASARSTGDVIDFGDSGEELKGKNPEHFDFGGWGIALFAGGFEGAKLFSPKEAAGG